MPYKLFLKLGFVCGQFYSTYFCNHKETIVVVIILGQVDATITWHTRMRIVFLALVGASPGARY